MPKLTIDGQEVEAEGDNLIKAARKIGREIPHFCYHEKLTIAANCRICLVEIEKQPKLQPACQQMATDGMVVHTQSKKAVEARAAVMEFLLLNHPLDCPICDKAGECKLQDYYMEDDGQNSRQKEAKTQKPRLETLGPLVNYNAERCIMCTRCVRFMDEIPKNTQLCVEGRGDRNVIATFPGMPLDDPYSLNVVELCPVGALGNIDFRFHSRVWQLDKANTVCGGCSKGCNTEAHHKNGVLYRLVPRQNDAVNSTWMCDEGRLSYHKNNDNRAIALYMKGQPVLAEEALNAARAFWDLIKKDQGTSAAIYVSPMLTNEEAFAWLSSVKSDAPKAKLFWSGNKDGTGDELLRRADKNANRKGVSIIAEALGLSLKAFDGKSQAQAVILLGGDLPNELTLPATSMVISAHATKEFLAAHVALPLATHFEQSGSFVNEDGRVQRVRPTHAPHKQGEAGYAWAQVVTGAKWPSAEATFSLLALRVPAFAGLEALQLGQQGKLLAGQAVASKSAEAQS